MVRVIHPGMPMDVRILFSGYLPNYAYDLGATDTSVSFKTCATFQRSMTRQRWPMPIPASRQEFDRESQRPVEVCGGAGARTSRANQPDEHIRAIVIDRRASEYDDETCRTLCELASGGYSNLVALLFRRHESGRRQITAADRRLRPKSDAASYRRNYRPDLPRHDECHEILCRVGWSLS